MANVQISELPQATGLVDTDLIAGNHGGITQKIPLSLMRSHLGVPAVSASDNGKYLGVSNGAWAVVDPPVILNPNLLDNWYWLNPVNQKGVTSLSASGWSIDRWYANNTTDFVVSSSGISFSTGYLIYNYLPDYIKGKTLTFSVLLADGSFYTGSKQLNFTVSGYQEITYITNSYFRCAVRQDSTMTILSVMVYPYQAITVVAVKLELGDTQTLAHQENGVWVLNEIPDYSEQLLKCQRYFQRFRTQSLRPTYAEDFRPAMRKNPSLTTQTIDGTLYYVASAE